MKKNLSVVLLLLSISAFAQNSLASSPTPSSFYSKSSIFTFSKKGEMGFDIDASNLFQKCVVDKSAVRGAK